MRHSLEGKASYAARESELRAGSGRVTGHAVITDSGHQWPMNFRHGEGGNRGGTMRIVSAHKILTAVIGALILLALCAGTAMAVTTATNSHNAAVQRAAAAAQAHRRAVRTHDLVARRGAQRQAAALAQAERDARQARRAANRPIPAPVAVVPAAPAAPPEGSTQPGSQSYGLQATGIGTNGEEVYSNSVTSTAFAMNVESDYWNAPGMTFTSYSPVTGQDYYMTAVVSGGTVTVTNSNG